MIREIFKSSWFLAVYAAFALTAALYISFFVVPIFFVWFGLIYFLLLEFNRKRKAKKRLILYFYLFPAIEILLYVILFADLPFYSGDAMNLLEHGFAAFFMGLLVYEVISLNGMAAKSGVVFNAIFVIGAVSLMGIFNEFWEFYLRMFSDTKYCVISVCELMSETSLEYYYIDSMKDLAVNLLGAVTAVVAKKRIG